MKSSGPVGIACLSVGVLLCCLPDAISAREFERTVDGGVNWVLLGDPAGGIRGFVSGDFKEAAFPASSISSTRQSESTDAIYFATIIGFGVGTVPTSPVQFQLNRPSCIRCRSDAKKSEVRQR